MTALCFSIAKCDGDAGDDAPHAVVNAVHIRPGRVAEDKAVMIGFIDGLQAFEHAFEPDRRIDAKAGADFLPVLLERVEKQDGRIFIADDDGGAAIGWAVFHTLEHLNYIVPEERLYGYVAELFVVEAARAQGVGRALIAACEDVARQMKLKSLMIGVLSKNARARNTYEAAGLAPYALELRKYL